MPVAFLPLGGGPVSLVEMGFAKSDVEPLGAYWRSVRELPPVQPKALLVVSAHWEAAGPTVMTSPHPPMLYDYSGFPSEAYQITWPAPGDPELAAHVRELVGRAGFATAADGDRGFDHGTFTPLKQAYPDADVPVVQLSPMAKALDAGRAPAPRPRAGPPARRGRLHRRQRRLVPQHAQLRPGGARAVTEVQRLADRGGDR